MTLENLRIELANRRDTSRKLRVKVGASLESTKVDSFNDGIQFAIDLLEKVEDESNDN